MTYGTWMTVLLASGGEPTSHFRVAARPRSKSRERLRPPPPQAA